VANVGEESVISGDKCNGAKVPLFKFMFRRPEIVGMNWPDHPKKPDMLLRPHDLADRMSATPPPRTFTLPIEAARVKAREILDRFPQSGYMAVVENWRQLPDGRIEFTMRHLPSAD
jgi:hypothetical protein